MARFSTRRPNGPNTTRWHEVLKIGMCTSALLLAGCTVALENTQAAQELARSSKPQGSVYIGWRVFQDRCAHCHGTDATAGAHAPDLLPIVREMTPRQFIGVVLKRYEWHLPPEQTDGEGAAMDTLIDDILQRKGPVMSMPDWDGEPRVNAHIVDLYTYLWARAQGTQGPGRP